MSWFRTIQEWFAPPEAAIVARQYRAAAKDIRRIQKQIQASKAYLDSNWIGQAKHNFMLDMGSLPEDIGQLADQLDQIADEMKYFMVSIDIKQIHDDILGWINYK